MRAHDRIALPLDRDPLKQLAVDIGKNPTGQGADKAREDAAKSNANGILTTIGLFDRILHVSDVFEWLSGREDGDLDDLGTRWLEQKYKAQAALNNVVNQWLGWLNADIDWTPDDQAMALGDMASTVATLTAQVAALQSDKNNAAVGGVSQIVDLTGLADSPTIPGYSHQRSGGGGHYEVRNGVGLVWVPVSDADATDNFTSDLETATDYQKSFLSLAAVPTRFNSGVYARNEIHNRKNASGDTYVFGGLEKYGVDIGCIVGGARSVFKTREFSVKSNALYVLESGTVGVGDSALRVHRLWEGNTIILVAPEVGTTSMAGPDYRRTGGSGSAKASNLGTTPPGVIRALAMGDNYPPTRVGSVIKLGRTNTSLIGVNDGMFMLPPGFWDIVREQTSDFEVVRNESNQIIGIKVLNDGQYRIGIRIAIGSSYPRQLTLAVAVNEGLAEVIGTSVPRGVAALGGAVTPDGIAASTVLALQAGDIVAGGYLSDGPSTGVLMGDIAGNRTFMDVSLQNRSLA